MIEEFSFWCQKVLPLVYDDSVSYWETLCKVSGKLNEVISHYNAFATNTKSYIDQRLAGIINEWTEIMNNALTSQNAYVSTQIQNNKDWLMREIEAADLRVTNRLSENAELVKDTLAQNERHMDALRESVINAINDLQEYVDKQVATLNEAIQSGDASQRAYTNAKIAELRAEIPSITSVIVTDPVTGTQMPIQDALENMYSVLRYGGLTAAEYDTLAVTAQTYDAKYMTAWEYDLYALRVLWPYMPCCMEYHPATGERVKTQFAAYYLANFVRTNGDTARAYEDADLTALAYQDLNLTAYTYDWSGV